MTINTTQTVVSPTREEAASVGSCTSDPQAIVIVADPHAYSNKGICDG